eukprot:2022328-Rhodomonas_salina.1
MKEASAHNLVIHVVVVLEIILDVLQNSLAGYSVQCDDVQCNVMQCNCESVTRMLCDVKERGRGAVLTLMLALLLFYNCVIGEPKFRTNFT